jgi:hypothetical protein
MSFHVNFMFASRDIVLKPKWWDPVNHHCICRKIDEETGFPKSSRMHSREESASKSLFQSLIALHMRQCASKVRTLGDVCNENWHLFQDRLLSQRTVPSQRSYSSRRIPQTKSYIWIVKCHHSFGKKTKQEACHSASSHAIWIVSRCF